MRRAILVALLVVLVGLATSRPARAVDFPGRVTGADLMLRNGELLSAGLRAAYLWRIPATEYTGLGAIASAELALGGVAAGAGPITMFHCVHAFGCSNISLEAKAFRPALLSPWDHQTRVGPELALGFAFFKLTAAAYRRFDRDTWSAAVGVGLTLLL
jgi:hypothetical protein